MPSDVLDGVMKWYVGKPPACALWGLFSCPPPHPGSLRDPMCTCFPPSLQSLGCTHTLPAVGSGLHLFQEFFPGYLGLPVPE